MISKSQPNPNGNGEQTATQIAPLRDHNSLSEDERNELFERYVANAESTKEIERKLQLSAGQIRQLTNSVADSKSKEELPRKERYAVKQIAKIEALQRDLIQLWNESKSRPQTTITKRYDNNGNLVDKTIKESTSPQLSIIKALTDLCRVHSDIAGTNSRLSTLSQTNINIDSRQIDVSNLGVDELKTMVTAKRIIDSSAND